MNFQGLFGEASIFESICFGRNSIGRENMSERLTDLHLFSLHINTLSSVEGQPENETSDWTKPGPSGPWIPSLWFFEPEVTENFANGNLSCKAPSTKANSKRSKNYYEKASPIITPIKPFRRIISLILVTNCSLRTCSSSNVRKKCSLPY